MPKSQINELVLIESRSARNSQISDVSDERALKTLNKAKALVMALWQGTGIATSKQLAEYFEISEETVQKVYQRNRAELTENGAKVVKGKDLKLVVDSLSTTGTRIRSSLIVWTPRSTLGLGMLLQDSPVAKQVRTVILDIVEEASPKKSIRDQILAIHPTFRTSFF